jgi:hypothetical protein
MASGARITFPPAAVQVDVELLINTVAKLYAIERAIGIFNGSGVTTSDPLGEVASKLLAAIAPDGPSYDPRHPIVVEVHARAAEHVSSYLAEYEAEARRCRNEAAEIREARHAFPEDAEVDHRRDVIEGGRDG